MSVYNGQRYLRESIKSILNQTHDDFEFIIVNDGSIDRTSEILDSFRDARIVLLENNENVGLSRSLNKGISISRGEYIARQDADDISHPERLLAQVQFLDHNPEIGVVGTSVQWINNQKKIIKIWPTENTNEDLQSRLLVTCPLIHGSTMYRRLCFQEVGGYDASMRTGQDYDFWLRISETWKLACLPDILYTYRWHGDMVSNKRHAEQNQNAQAARSKAIRRRLFYSLQALGYHERIQIPTRMLAFSRQQLAELYTYWSQGARPNSKLIALTFLIIALLFYPRSRTTWFYIKGIAERKKRIFFTRDNT